MTGNTVLCNPVPRAQGFTRGDGFGTSANQAPLTPVVKHSEAPRGTGLWQPRRLGFSWSQTMQRLVICLSFAGAVLAAQPALATASSKVKAVHGVSLSSLCKGCAVVSKEHTETRKGKPSGVGAVGGAVAGGVIGNQFGHGNGKAAMTVLGAVGGGVAGNEIEKNVKKYTVWVTTVTFKDGTTKRYERTSDPNLRPGDVVQIVKGQPVRRAENA